MGRFLQSFLSLVLALSASQSNAASVCAGGVAARGVPPQPSSQSRRYIGSPPLLLMPGKYRPAEVVHLKADPVAAAALLKKPKSVFATWNLENLFYHVGKFIPDPEQGVRVQVEDPKPKSPEALAEVIERIERMNPDFMAAQEIEDQGNSDSLETFAAQKLDASYRACDVKGNDKRGIRVGQLSRGFDVQYESHRDLPWIDPYYPPMYPERTKLFSRDAAVAILRIPGFDEPYAVVLIEHGKSQRTEINEDFKSKVIRAEEQKGVAALFRYYKLRYPKSPFLIMGDLNAELYSHEFFPIRDEGFRDVFDMLPTRVVPREDRLSQSYHPLFRGIERRAVHGQLDYILTNSQGHRYVLDSRVVRPLDEKGQERPLAESYAERSTRGGSDHDARILIFDNQRRLKDMGVIR